MTPLEAYLTAMRQDFETGQAQDEVTYYPHLANLLNTVGHRLKPKVRCLLHPKNRGAGFPDGGFFSADQRFRGVELQEITQLPSRGAIEVKGLSDDVAVIAQSEQVAKYVATYRQVLVTNYREFLLVGPGPDEMPVQLEPVFRLADNDSAFWDLARRPRRAAEGSEADLIDFFVRVLLHESEIRDPKQVAGILAAYAREALRRAEATDLPALAGLRRALEDALGMHFQGTEGEHFFRSTLVQTLFYGLFSGCVLWRREPGRKAGDRFTWHEASWHMGVPIIAALFRQLETPALLKPSKLDEVMDWATSALNRIVPEEFFRRFEEAEAVEYFYEPFLEAFDPVLRKKYGVWYTPREVVQYMVERVDRVLRNELGVADGLADPSVVVLDPCCGTGTYLVEVLHRIYATLQQKGADALTPADVKQAAIQRVFDFEIMPAPYVVTHLQLGLLLRHLQAPLDTSRDERAAVYLTNALTGWEAPDGPKQELIDYPDLQAERDHAEHVKREERILVVIGNPPYNAFAGTAQDLEARQIEPYKTGLADEWRVRKFNLDDLYVRFFRVAERRIAEVTKKGIVCFISNFSYLGDPSFVVMRRQLLHSFDSLWLDCMNGDSRETGKLTPEGKPDPSVFSTEYNRAGIRVGTAIALLIKRPSKSDDSKVRFRHFWGSSKRTDLINSLNDDKNEFSYLEIKPNRDNPGLFTSCKSLLALCGIVILVGPNVIYGSIRSPFEIFSNSSHRCFSEYCLIASFNKNKESSARARVLEVGYFGFCKFALLRNTMYGVLPGKQHIFASTCARDLIGRRKIGGQRHVISLHYRPDSHLSGWRYSNILYLIREVPKALDGRHIISEVHPEPRAQFVPRRAMRNIGLNGGRYSAQSGKYYAQDYTEESPFPGRFTPNWRGIGLIGVVGGLLCLLLGQLVIVAADRRVLGAFVAAAGIAGIMSGALIFALW